jgi:hypothetical protein
MAAATTMPSRHKQQAIAHTDGSSSRAAAWQHVSVSKLSVRHKQAEQIDCSSACVSSPMTGAAPAAYETFTSAGWSSLSFCCKPRM